MAENTAKGNESKPKQLREENNERADGANPTYEKGYFVKKIKKKQIRDFRNNSDVNINQHYHNKYLSKIATHGNIIMT